MDLCRRPNARHLRGFDALRWSSFLLSCRWLSTDNALVKLPDQDSGLRGVVLLLRYQARRAEILRAHWVEGERYKALGSIVFLFALRKLSDLVLLAALGTRDVSDLGDLKLRIGLRSDRHKELLV